MLLNKRVFVTFVGMLLFGFFVTPPAFGDAGGANYSDTWLVGPGTEQYVEEDEPVSGFYVVGCGVTDESYNNYGHETYVQTTLTNPNSETANASAGGGSYAQAEATLDWRFIELDSGEFSVESSHSYFCPIASRDIDLGSTFDIVVVGGSKTCYQYAETLLGLDVFYIVNNCSSKVTCPGSGTIAASVFFHLPDHLIRLETWIAVFGSPRYCTGDKAIFPSRNNACTSSACKDIPALPN